MTSVAGREGGARTGEGGERKSYKLSLLGLLIVASCALHSVMEWNIISYPEQVRAGVTAEGGARPGVW